MRKIAKNKTLSSFYLNHLKEERSFRRLKMILMLGSGIVLSITFVGALYFLFDFVVENTSQKIFKDQEFFEFGEIKITLRFFFEFTISLGVALISLLLSWISWASFFKTLSLLKILKKINDALEEDKELLFKTPKNLSVTKRLPLFLFKSNFPLKVRAGSPKAPVATGASKSRVAKTTKTPRAKTTSKT